MSKQKNPGNVGRRRFLSSAAIAGAASTLAMGAVAIRWFASGVGATLAPADVVQT